MSRQVGSLHRSISYLANLQNNLPIIPLFVFPQPQSPHLNTSSSMESDTNSNTTVYYTIYQFNNSDIKTPDKFDNSEPSSSTFYQPPFQPIHSQVKNEPSSPPSPISYVTPTALIRPLKQNSQIPHSHLTQEHPPHLSIIHLILIPKNSSKSVFLFSLNIHTSIQTAMLKNPIMLTNMFYTLHLHGHLITTLLTHYHYHYITPLMIMKYVAPNSIF